MRAANWAIGAEEAAFLPVYLALLPFLHGTALLMTALVGADVLVAAGSRSGSPARLPARLAPAGLAGWPCGNLPLRPAWPGGRHAVAD